MTDVSQIRDELLSRHKGLKLQDSNEAETRVKLIDRILYEILGWSHDDIAYEERVSEDKKVTYADYIIRTANTAYVVEAKRVGVAIYTVPSKRRLKLSGAIMEGETGDAIKQARDYGRKKSIPYAVVTNGDQWIIFPAVRTDQVEFQYSSAIIFDSLESCLGSEFEDFYSLLSRDGVIDGNLETELIGRNEDQLAERRLGAFFTTTANPSVNPIYPLIESSVHTAFSDALFSGESDLLEKCYINTADRIKFDNRIKMHLSKREPLFREQPSRPMRKRESGALKKALETATSLTRPLAILLLGPVGAGKTTFITYTRKITAREFFEKRTDKEYPHWIEVDFREFSPNSNALEFIIDCIFDYMKSDSFFSEYNRAIRSAYKDDIDALKRGPLYL